MYTQPLPHLVDSPLRLVRVGLIRLSPELRIESADGEAARIFRREASELSGISLEDVVPAQNEPDRATLRGAPPFSYLGVTAPTPAPVLIQVSRLEGGTTEGSLIASVISVNAWLAESQSLARVQLRKTVEAIIAGFAHEVRNPLASILSLVEAAMFTDRSPDSPLLRIPGLVARVEMLIRQSLAYGRPSQPRRTLLPAARLVESSLALLRPRELRARLRAAPFDQLPPLLVDPQQCEQVLVNLIENALDAARSEVSVSGRLGQTAVPSVCVEVSDDGPGIPAEVAERIFDPFFTTKAQGTGLGLAIARDLARLNGGDLRHLASRPGGAVFSVWLPTTPAPIRDPW
jgi:signal transduction histidine kinase